VQELFSGVLASWEHTRCVSAEEHRSFAFLVFTRAALIRVAFIVAVLPTNHLFGHWTGGTRIERSDEFGGRALPG
jgi:hypothetical protein